MQRFFGLLLIPFLVTTVSVYATRMIGGLHPSSAAVLFTNPDGSPCKLPCLFGIRPGETTVEEALRLLKTHPLTHSFAITSKSPLTLEGPVPGSSNVVFSVTPGGLVDVVILSANVLPRAPGTPPPAFLPETASIGDFLSIFGTPEMITGYRRGSTRVDYTFLKALIWVQARILSNRMRSIDRINEGNSVIKIR